MGVSNKQIGWSVESNLIWNALKELDKLNKVTGSSMSSIVASLATKITNEQGVPSFYSDSLANIPPAGTVGRMFVSTDTFALYRDNGIGWDLIGSPGTGAITGSGTAGQVSFWNGTTSQTGSNNLWWDNVNGRLGIRTNAPTNLLTIGTAPASSLTDSSVISVITSENSNTLSQVITASSSSNTQRSSFVGVRARGTLVSPTAVQNADWITTFLSAGFDGTDRQFSGAILFQVDGAVSSGIVPQSVEFLTGTSTSNRSTKLRIGSNGNVIIQNGGTFTDAGFRLDVNGTTRLNGLQTFQGTTASDTAPLGSELATTGSGTNWTGTGFATGYTHTVGSTASLTTSIPAVNGTYYQITYTITGRTAGSITINYGGTSTSSITATGATGPLATSTANLEIVPTTDFDGTVVLSVRSIGTSSATTTINDSGGNSRIQIRATSSASNTLVGNNAGRRITTGINNSFFGLSAGLNTTTGTSNSFFGLQAGLNNTTGGSNSFFGVDTGLNNTTGGSNSFFGLQAGANNTTGGSNSFFGLQAGANNTTGSNNLSFGRGAGRLISSGGNLTIANNSVFLGVDTRANADNETNQTVIGYQAIGLGSNTTVIGNSSTTFGRWWGNLLIGTSVNSGFALDVSGTTRLNGLQTFQGTTASDTAPLGSELATTGSGTNWTGTAFSTGYTHVVGSTASLTTSIPAVNGTYYQIAYTITGRTAGSITINYGGTSTSGITATGATGPLATSTANLEIVPTSDFNGTVVLSVRSIGTSSATTTFNDSSGNARIQIRATSSTNNTIVGLNSGTRITTALSNSFYGQSAGNNTTTGNSNSFFGRESGFSNTIGISNSFYGSNSGFSNISGSANSFFGTSSGTNNTGNNNSFFGSNSGNANTTASSNSFFGVNSGFNNTTGSNNTFIGLDAGRRISGGGNLTVSTNSVFVGFDTRANADSETNQTVIGYQAIGLGSNTTVIGNSSTTFGRWWGNLLLGTSTNSGFLLDVNGTARFSNDVTIADTRNIILSTTTGTRIGTATNQRLSLWNATPDVQPTNAITAAAFVANTSGIVNDTATFGGYTIGQIVAALRRIGALA